VNIPFNLIANPSRATPKCQIRRQNNGCHLARVCYPDAPFSGAASPAGGSINGLKFASEWRQSAIITSNIIPCSAGCPQLGGVLTKGKM
jgi:hypothetical protein